MSEARYSIRPDEVYWTMHWTATNEKGERVFPNHPDTEQVFEVEKALAVLLMNDQVFLNTNWFKEHWSSEARKTTVLFVNCNDVFAWGCADAEELHIAEIQEVYDMYVKDPDWGTVVWCMKKRNLMPQKPVYDIIMKEGIWNLDAMNLTPNNE